MILGPEFERFVNESALSIMSRATIVHTLSASARDKLFDRLYIQMHTRELVLSTVIDWMSLVVCGKAHHVISTYNQLAKRVPVTLKSVYEKLQTSIEAFDTRARLHSSLGCLTPVELERQDNQNHP